MHNRIVVIVNPAARGEKARRMCEQIEQLSETATVHLTTAPGEACEFAKEAVESGCRTVVAAGGDGTINEVVNGIDDPEVKLGLLPIGTMNVFATELGLPVGDLRACWDAIEAGRIREVDLPQANGRSFVQLGGIGLDAQVVQETSWDFRKTWGPLSYLISATQIAARKPPRLIVVSDDSAAAREGSFVLVGNGRLYGGPFVLFKDALIDDGRLDVLVFKNLGYLDIVRYLHAIIMGWHPELHDVEYFQTERLTVSSANGEVPVEVDGEVIGNAPVTFSISPGKLRVIVQ